MNSKIKIFPKNIFQVWFQGCKSIQQEKFKENMSNWKSLNPNWKYSCIDNKALRKACYTYGCGELYDSLDIMHLKIDLGRYILVYLYGGIYVDMDAYVLRGLDYSEALSDLINKYEVDGKEILGLSRFNSSRFENLIYTGNFSDSMLNNAVLISSPNNTVLKEYIDAVVTKLEGITQFENKGVINQTVNFFNVGNTTGPYFFNTFFYYKARYSKTDSVIKLFDNEYFEPCIYKNGCSITENTISLHDPELSWLPKHVKVLFTTYKMYSNVTLVILLVLLYLYVNKKLFF